VNDGSTDNTLSILQKYAAEDPRIQIVSQQNAGLGAARNAGFAHATGEYISFVDSDDYLAPGAIALLTEEAVKTNADITMGARVKFNSKGSHISPAHTFAKYRPATTAREFTGVFGVIAVHGKLFKAAFLHKHHLTFQEVRAQEDSGFSYIAYRQARRITVIPDPVYYYRKRDGGEASITQSRLRRASLLGRFAQIETTISLAKDREGNLTTSHKNPYGLEFGKRLMRHIVKFQHAADDPITREALDMIATFSHPYRHEIAKHCDEVTLDVYRTIWARDLPNLKKALKRRHQRLTKAATQP